MFNIINFNSSINPVQRTKLNFRSSQQYLKSKATDVFNANNIRPSLNEIIKSANNNPRIREILREYNIPLHINMKELKHLEDGHLKDTRIISAKIYSSLPKEMKKEVNLVNLQQASALHDYGKILIPENILYKSDKLTEAERNIMQQHSELGYELLKDNNINQEVLNLVKYHHQTPTGIGYPQLVDNYQQSLENQILSVADKYSALTENRPYKQALSKDEALKIIYNDVENGNILPQVYEALVKSL